MSIASTKRGIGTNAAVRAEGRGEVSVIARLAADHRGPVITISLVLGGASTGWEAAVDPASRGIGALTGTFVGVSALVLALVIYWLSAQDTQRLLSKVADLEESLGSITPIVASATVSSIDAELNAHRPYVNALQNEIDIPDDDIRAVYDPGAGKGNRPRIIQTKKGYRYSVFHGGRGNTGYTVSQIGSPGSGKRR